MKTLKLLLASIVFISSCVSVNHEYRKYDAKGLAYKYGEQFVGNHYREFYRLLENKDIEKNTCYVQTTDSTWTYTQNEEMFSCTCLYVVNGKNRIKSMSLNGLEYSDEYSVHFFTTDSLVFDYYQINSGIVRVEVLKENNLIGWSEFEYKPDSINQRWYTATSGIPE